MPRAKTQILALPVAGHTLYYDEAEPARPLRLCARWVSARRGKRDYASEAWTVRPAGAAPPVPRGEWARAEPNTGGARGAPPAPAPALARGGAGPTGPPRARPGDEEGRVPPHADGGASALSDEELWDAAAELPWPARSGGEIGAGAAAQLWAGVLAPAATRAAYAELERRLRARAPALSAVSSSDLLQLIALGQGWAQSVAEAPDVLGYLRQYEYQNVDLAAVMRAAA